MIRLHVIHSIYAWLWFLSSYEGIQEFLQSEKT